MEYAEHLHRGEVDGIPVGELTLYCCGSRVNAPNHGFGPAARDNTWLIFLREGSGWYEVEHTRYALEKGMVFTAFPGRRICYRADAGSVWSIRWVCLGGENLPRYLELAGITPENPVIRAKAPLALDTVFRSLLETVQENTVSAKLRCAGLVWELISQLAADEKSPAPRRDYLDEAIFFARHHYDRGISVRDMADSVNVSAAYFSRLFRHRMGISPSQWLTEYRMERACALLRETNLTVGEVARSVGYEDALYFSRCFSTREGCSPGMWRKRLGEKN